MLMTAGLPLLPAQTASDAVLMPAGRWCVALPYENTTWSTYWEGAFRRTNANIGTFTRQSLSPQIAIGLTDDLNLMAGVSWISTAATGGQLAGVTGWQDLQVALKARLLDLDRPTGRFEVLATAGFGTPIANYLADYQPFSIGLGTTEWSLRSIFQYRSARGWYLQGTMGYLWRGLANAEKRYHYNQGSVYSEWMDVPNAWQAQLAAGWWLWQNTLRGELQVQRLDCPRGDDIRTYNAPQPTNQVKQTQLGLLIQWYPSRWKGIGLLGQARHVVAGRNTGIAQTWLGGVLYQFSWKKRPQQ